MKCEVLLLKEIDYFKIGHELGFNQDRFRDAWMKLGGCASVTACDASICFSRYHGKKELYPFDDEHVDLGSYVEFSKIMKPYLRPRWSGIDTLSVYRKGYEKYLCENGNRDILLSEVPGEAPVFEGMERVKEQIDKNIPVPCLLLRHKDPSFSDFIWHWFNIGGYDSANGFEVLVFTYGRKLRLDFKRMWDTGFAKKGGLILLNPLS